jgi:hypothetical protein
MKISATILMIILFISACDDIFETDISSEQVVVLSPGDDITLSDQNVSFWWESVDHADSYTLHIVLGSFEHITKVICDTTVSEHLITKNLQPGDYEWRLKAVNSISETEFTTASFIIDTTSVK